jgi:hypothetical protein
MVFYWKKLLVQVLDKNVQKLRKQLIKLELFNQKGHDRALLQSVSAADGNGCADIHLTIQAIIISSKVGGAAFAALVALIGLPISIEPLIDVGRTALNVGGSIAAGIVTSGMPGQTDMERFDSDDKFTLENDQQGA